MIDLQLFKNIMAEARNNPTLLDSYSPNQFKAKEKIVEHVNQFVDTNSEIVILGGWYGSILVPFFKHVKRITIIDLDDHAISISKNRLFSHYDNIDYIASDVFDKKRHGRIMNADLIINPSCEHMPSMKTLDALKTSKAYFAFTSNNMYGIEGHTNCVSSIQEFKDQLPDNATVTVEDEIKDSRGIRYLIVGKLC
jgi:hypothetical protein